MQFRVGCLGSVDPGLVARPGLCCLFCLLRLNILGLLADAIWIGCVLPVAAVHAAGVADLITIATEDPDGVSTTVGIRCGNLPRDDLRLGKALNLRQVVPPNSPAVTGHG